ncbi:uncharacterized protein [Miscanthus floridulus]|uniref:uncharacterized protein n=1 Tax=Miscanthus floridulus TaxID=154761 RepID=UPI00345A1DB6
MRRDFSGLERIPKRSHSSTIYHYYYYSFCIPTFVSLRGHVTIKSCPSDPPSKGCDRLKWISSKAAFMFLQSFPRSCSRASQKKKKYSASFLTRPSLPRSRLSRRFSRTRCVTPSPLPPPPISGADPGKAALPSAALRTRPSGVCGTAASRQDAAGPARPSLCPHCAPPCLRSSLFLAPADRRCAVLPLEPAWANLWRSLRALARDASGATRSRLPNTEVWTNLGAFFNVRLMTFRFNSFRCSEEWNIPDCTASVGFHKKGYLAFRTLQS